MRGRGRLLALLATLAVAGIWIVLAEVSAAREAPKHSKVLQPNYRIAATEPTDRCTVYESANYQGGWWTVEPRQRVKWRYNWSDSLSVIIDPTHEPVHWGFIKRDCIGTSIGDPPPCKTYEEIEGKKDKRRICKVRYPKGHGWPAGVPVPPVKPPIWPKGYPVPSGEQQRFRSQGRPEWKKVEVKTTPKRQPNAAIKRPVMLRDDPNGVGLGTLHANWPVYRKRKVLRRGYLRVFSPTVGLWGWVQTGKEHPNVSPPHAKHRCGNYGDPGDGKPRWTYRRVYGFYIVNVTSRGVGCGTARRVARHAFESYSGPRWKYREWDCRIRSQKLEYQDVQCTKSGGRVVRWETGA